MIVDEVEGCTAGIGSFQAMNYFQLPMLSFILQHQRWLQRQGTDSMMTRIIFSPRAMWARVPILVR